MISKLKIRQIWLKIRHCIYLLLYNMKKIILSSCLIITWLVLAGCWWSWDSNVKPTDDNTAQVCNKTQCFKIDIARTADEQRKWLMWVEELAQDQWMLFAFENPWVHEFRMKDTLIPLDMIWLNESWEVLYIKEYAPPCSAEDSAKDDCQLFWPKEWTLASYVLEVNANMTREAGIYEWIKLDLYNVN